MERLTVRNEYFKKRLHLLAERAERPILDHLHKLEAKEVAEGPAQKGDRINIELRLQKKQGLSKLLSSVFRESNVPSDFICRRFCILMLKNSKLPQLFLSEWCRVTETSSVQSDKSIPMLPSIFE